MQDSGCSKEYFNLSIKNTLKTWSVMETIVSVAGLISVTDIKFMDLKNLTMEHMTIKKRRRTVCKVRVKLTSGPHTIGCVQTFLIDGKYLYVSGHGPVLNNRTLITGRIGKDLDIEQGKQAAQQVGLTILSTIRTHVGDLDRVKRVIKILGNGQLYARF